jgi:hypothetical protein
VILLIALTSPQRGTHLDPTGRSSFKLLTQIWLFSLAQIMFLVILAGTSRTGGHFVNTLQSGSTYAYISVTMSLEDYNKIQNVFPIELRDSSGKVGDVTNIQFHDTNSFGNKQPFASMVVATQRWHIPYERSNQNKAEVRSNGVIFISQ